MLEYKREGMVCLTNDVAAGGVRMGLSLHIF